MAGPSRTDRDLTQTELAALTALAEARTRSPWPGYTPSTFRALAARQLAQAHPPSPWRTPAMCLYSITPTGAQTAAQTS